MFKRLPSKPLIWTTVGAVLLGVVFAAWWFQPWKLWIDSHVDETLPTTVNPVESDDVEQSKPPVGPVALASGEFVSHEHATSGAASLVEHPDGSRQLALEDLDTSNGPDLQVWLTDAQVDPDSWHVFDDGYYVELGPLKGNQGDQVYDVPTEADLDRVVSVSVWCERFSVSFGAAELD